MVVMMFSECKKTGARKYPLRRFVAAYQSR
jgi:hypothetical protein